MKNIIEKIKVNVGNDEKNSVIVNLRDGGDCYENFTKSIVNQKPLKVSLKFSPVVWL